jgi:hypothetical protein
MKGSNIVMIISIMDRFIKDLRKMDKEMVKECSIIKMEGAIRASGRIIKCLALENCTTKQG